jgi:AcrR family transcriptional regulator
MDRKKTKLDKSKWLDAGLDALFEDGIEAVKVEPLARRLKVTKGSFYWHFTDRRALLDGMIGRWVDVQSLALAQHRSGDISAREMVLKLLNHIPSKDARHDIAMRIWARTDVAAATAVADLDARRIALVTELFVQLGDPDTEAAFKARLLYYFQLGDQLVLDPAASDDRAVNFEQLGRVLLSGDTG